MNLDSASMIVHDVIQGSGMPASHAYGEQFP